MYTRNAAAGLAANFGVYCVAVWVDLVEGVPPVLRPPLLQPLMWQMTAPAPQSTLHWLLHPGGGKKRKTRIIIQLDCQKVTFPRGQDVS